MTETDRAVADELLIQRLSELSLVDPDGLLSGGSDGATLIQLHVQLLESALVEARMRVKALVAACSRDPLELLDMSAARRVGEQGREMANRTLAGLANRRSACATIARLDEACGRVIPRLVEFQHRQ